VRLLTFSQLKSEKGIRYVRDHLRRKCDDGSFPKPVQISAARIGWVEAEVDYWLLQLIAQRDGTAAPPELAPPQADLLAIPDCPMGSGRMRG
jgi:prophage regulatory protein